MFMTQSPSRVLRCIFQCLLDEPIDATSPAQGPCRLAQVCRHWRIIAESDPLLWSFIHLYVPNLSRPVRIVSRVRLLFDLHLKRSGALPISLAFNDSRNRLSCMDELIFLLVDQLRMHSRRWARISLTVPQVYFPHLPTFTPCDLPSLEHLRIVSKVRRDQFTSCLDLGSAKNLKSFAYCGPGNLALARKINLDWEQLEEVSFQYLTYYDKHENLSFGHVECLALCRNLITCSLDTRTAGSLEENEEWPVVILCRLQTLRVRLSVDSNADKIIDFLRLPNLQTLDIDLLEPVSYCPPLRDGYNFARLLQISRASLRHLSIRNAELPSDEILRCLELSSKLSSFYYILHRKSRNTFGDVVCSLKVFPRAVEDQLHKVYAPLVPELREITLGSSVQAYFDTTMAAIRSRGGSRAHAAGVAALQRVEVVYVSYGTPFEEVAAVKNDLAQWVSEMEKENSSTVAGDAERLGMPVVVFSVRPHA